MKSFAIILLIIAAGVFLTQAQDIPGLPNCDPAVVTWHPHPLVCTQYIICFHGNPIERLCSPGLHYNRILEQCMKPQLAMCDINYACPAQDDRLNPVFLPDGDDCSKYFVCFEGSPIPRDCAEDLWWDVVYNWCTIAEEVSCDARVPNNPNTPVLPPTEAPTTQAPTEPPTDAPTLPPTNPPTLPPTEPPTNPPTEPPTTLPSTTTQDPSTYDCPLSSDPTFHPHSRDCDRYFICINGVAFLRQCAEGLLFDIIERKCYDSDLATCISGATVDPNHPVFELAEGWSFNCPLHVNYEILFFPHQTKCNKFYLCEKGVSFVQKCAIGQHYDIPSEKCRDEKTAVCLQDL